MPTTAPQALANLETIISAALADEPNVELIMMRPGPHMEDEAVWIGSTVVHRQDWKSWGQLRQAEEYDITCHVWCKDGDFNPLRQALRSYALFALIENALLADITLGIDPMTTPRARISALSVVSGDTEHGGTDGQLDFTITVNTLILRTGS